MSELTTFEFTLLTTSPSSNSGPMNQVFRKGVAWRLVGFVGVGCLLMFWHWSASTSAQSAQLLPVTAIASDLYDNIVRSSPGGCALIEISLPAAFPAIFTVFRISVGVALVVSVIAEMIAGTGGAGYFVLQAQETLRVNRHLREHHRTRHSRMRSTSGCSC